MSLRGTPAYVGEFREGPLHDSLNLSALLLHGPF